MELTRFGVVGVGLLVVVALTPVWAAYGALVPGEEHGGGHGAGEDAFDTAAFVQRTLDYASQHGTTDGAVEAMPGEPVPMVAQQFGFLPRELRLRTGETYVLDVVSKDVIHGFSLQQGAGSLNAVVVPGTPTRITLTPTQPGEYLLLCNEYCGLGHQFMSGRIIVEGPAVQPDSMEMDGHGSSDQDQPSPPGPPAHVMPSGMSRPTATDMNHGNDGGHQP